MYRNNNANTWHGNTAAQVAEFIHDEQVYNTAVAAPSVAALLITAPLIYSPISTCIPSIPSFYMI